MRRAWPCAGIDECRDVAARKFAAIKHSLEHSARFGGQIAEPDFLLGPKQDARTQPVRLHQLLHEFDLVDADAQEECA